MNKKIISAIILLLLLTISLSTVSAALCKGKDGYYHDCKNYDYYCDDYYTGDLNWFREHKCDLNDDDEDEDDEDAGYFVYHEWSRRTKDSGHYDKDSGYYYDSRDYKRDLKYNYNPTHYYTIDAPTHRYVTYDYETIYPTITRDLFGFHNHLKIDSNTIPRYPSNIRYIF